MPRKWAHILIHHSAGSKYDTVASLRHQHVEKRGWDDIGYHYVLQRYIQREPGYAEHLIIKEGRPDTKTGAHAGRGWWNRYSLGVCVIGYFHPGASGVSEHFTSDMYTDLVGALAHLCKKYGISPKNIGYHRDVKATACPGSWFPDKAQVIADVEKAIKG